MLRSENTMGRIRVADSFVPNKFIEIAVNPMKAILKGNTGYPKKSLANSPFRKV
jgi:hypothetical protein